MYKKWHGFGVGSSVVLWSITDAKGQSGKTTTTTRYTIREDNDRSVLLEMVSDTVRFDGEVVRGTPEEIRYAKWLETTLEPGALANDDAESTDAPITIAGRTFLAHCRKTKDRNEAGVVHATTWVSDAVPGSLLKSLIETPSIQKTTSIELVELHLAQPMTKTSR